MNILRWNKEKQSGYKEPAYIVVTQHNHELFGERWYTYTYEWRGSKYASAYISKYYMAQIPDPTLRFLPWPVKILSEVDFGRDYEVVRKDVGLHLWWILVWLKRWPMNSRGYQHFKWRVIMTFDIWGLAYQPEAEMTSWKNIGRKRKKK